MSIKLIKSDIVIDVEKDKHNSSRYHLLLQYPAFTGDRYKTNHTVNSILMHAFIGMFDEDKTDGLSIQLTGGTDISIKGWSRNDRWEVYLEKVS